MRYIYYAHAMAIYGTPREESEIADIRRVFPGMRILNPNGAVDQSLDGQAAMRQCLEFVRGAFLVVFSQVRIGWVGRGVYREIVEAQDHYIPIYLVNDGTFYDTFSLSKPDAGPNWRYYANIFNQGRNKSISEQIQAGLLNPVTRLVMDLANALKGGPH